MISILVPVDTRSAKPATIRTLLLLVSILGSVDSKFSGRGGMGHQRVAGRTWYLDEFSPQVNTSHNGRPGDPSLLARHPWLKKWASVSRKGRGQEL